MYRLTQVVVKRAIAAVLCFPFMLMAAQPSESFSRDAFANPNDAFYPMPFWHINGLMTQEGIETQLSNAKHKGGFKGVAVLPVAHTQPSYLSEDYFAMYKHILDTAKSLGMKVILYDDTGFPSGTAGGKIEKNHPEFVRRILIKHEVNLRPDRKWRIPVPKGPLMATVAMNTETFERINVGEHIRNGFLDWHIPKGKWKILFFTTDVAPYWKDAFPVDYMNPEAVNQFIQYTYQDYANRFEKYFKDTIELTFFDDVGFLWLEKSWTNKFNEKFRELYQTDPAIYYPALWYDIGADTESARVALFNTRAELLAEGYPKKVNEWAKTYGLKTTGHPPGNYDIQPTDMHGDIFKFYRHSDYPLMDYIINYGRGRDGFKLISSAATLYDRPIVATEIYGAFKEATFDKNMLYRAMMELFARGVNFVVPHGMWYDWDNVRIPPLVSAESKKIVADLPAYSDYVARSSYLLREGRPIADIAVLYPIASLQGAYHFDEPTNTVPGEWAYPEADYQKISGLLSLDIRRDFTFVHPEHLARDQYQVVGSHLTLFNEKNPQTYQVMIMPGGKVISVAALKKIKAFYDAGGKVIATTLLPTRSAEFQQDAAVLTLITEMFGTQTSKKPKVQKNSKGGMALFIPTLSEKSLAKALTDMAPAADVIFDKQPKIKSNLGVFSYYHKIRDGKNIYFFANSSDDLISTDVLIKGSHTLIAWDPHTGITTEPLTRSVEKRFGEIYTRIKLEQKPVSSIFWVSTNP